MRALNGINPLSDQRQPSTCAIAVKYAQLMGLQVRPVVWGTSAESVNKASGAKLGFIHALTQMSYPAPSLYGRMGEKNTVGWTSGKSSYK